MRQGALSLADAYRDQPTLRALIALSSGGVSSVVEAALFQTLDRLRNDRARPYFDELAKESAITDDPSLLESEDFLHRYTITTRAALNTLRRDKIRMFARLLTSSVRDPDLNDVDEYEELLRILDELSYRELRALSIFDDLGGGTPRNPDDNDIQWTCRFWDPFCRKMIQDLTIPTEDEVRDFMTRLLRTGCYRDITAGTWDQDQTIGMGALTPVYYRLRRYVTERDSEETV